MTRAPLWVVAIEVPGAAVEPFAALFEILGDGSSCFGTAGDGARWRIEALVADEPDRAAVEALLKPVSDAAGLPVPAVTIDRLPETDWLAENRRQFPPLSIGRFFVYGSYFMGSPPPGRASVALDAGLAFGSGTHGSTQGCLLAIDRLARRRRFRRPVDLGCGSGILALGMARRWRMPVRAADIDPIAVAVARANARRNRLAALVRPVVSNGFTGPALRRAAPYDLIVANILARPLERMAPQLARACAEGGVLVLSGLLAKQGAGVIAAYRIQGFAIRERLRVGEWLTLVLARAGGRRSHSEA